MNLAPPAPARDHTYPGLPDPIPAAPAPPVPAPRRRTRWTLAVPLLAAALGFVAVAAVIELRPSPPNPSPAPPPAARNLLVVKGSGTRRTRVFTTGTDWRLAYSYACPGRATFVVTAYPERDVLVNESAATGSDSVTRHGAPGTRRLEVDSPCTWTLTVTG